MLISSLNTSDGSILVAVVVIDTSPSLYLNGRIPIWHGLRNYLPYWQSIEMERIQIFVHNFDTPARIVILLFHDAIVY